MSATDPSDDADVREAFLAGDLYVDLQPIVDLKAGTVFGVETLLRSFSPKFRGPLDILDSALKSGYMGQLGREVRKLATTAAPDDRLFINVHPEEFSEGWLVRPDDPIYFHDHDVFLEITEAVPLTHFGQCHSILREVRDRGVFLVVDDLGAGYSNLKYIADLAPDIVKLDRELVSKLDEQKRLRALLGSLVRLCSDMGAKVVAEGIETALELKIVVESGVDFGQGYYIARPAHPVATIDWNALSGAGVHRKEPPMKAPRRP